MGKLFFDAALLPSGWAEAVQIDIGEDGVIASVKPGARRSASAERVGIGIPGMPNLHSHAFQRGMAGLAEVSGDTPDSFWTWRQVMYRFLERLTPDDVEAIAGQLYVEMLEAGFTSVGEFHYLHHKPEGLPYRELGEMASRIAAAAEDSGIGLTLLPVLYFGGGFGNQPLQPQQRRFASTWDCYIRLLEAAERHVEGLLHARVGVAPHSLRAVSPDLLAQLLRHRPSGPVHIHIAEQTKEVEDCLAWCRQRPVEWLIENCRVDERWCLVHATHMTPSESAAVTRSGAVVGLCPQTEANLGDGIFAGPGYLAAGGRIGIGTDSHIRVCAAEEVRTLEYSQRLRDRRRNVLGKAGASTGRLLYERSLLGGAQALGRAAHGLEVGQIADIVALEPMHPSLVWRSGDALLDGWLFCGDRSCVRDVWVAGRKVVSEGRHIRRDEARERFAKTMRRLI